MLSGYICAGALPLLDTDHQTIDLTTCYIILVVFIATLVRSSLGFGESLLAVPLLALRIPVQVAVPLSVLVSVTVAAWVVIQDGKKIHFRSAAGLVVFALAGLPIGLSLLSSAHEQLVKVLLAILILLFSAYALWGKPIGTSKSALWLGICGILSGVLGGAYGLNGPPLVVYGSMRRWSPQHFRATLQGYFLPASLCGMAGYWIKGLWVPAVTTHFLWCLPGVALAIWAGRAINSRLKGQGFYTYVYGALMIISIVLFVQALSV